MRYRAPVGEMRFLLDRVLGAGRLAETARFAEATPETVEAVLGEAARLAEDVLAPLQAGRRPRAGAARERRGADDAGVCRGLAAGGGGGLDRDRRRAPGTAAWGCR